MDTRFLHDLLHDLPTRNETDLLRLTNGCWWHIAKGEKSGRIPNPETPKVLAIFTEVAERSHPPEVPEDAKDAEAEGTSTAPAEARTGPASRACIICACANYVALYSIV